MQAHKVFVVAKRDYIATVRTKAFLFGLVVAPVLFGGGSIAMSLMKSGPDTKDRHIAIIDHTGMVADGLIRAAARKNARELFDKKTGRQIAPRYVFEKVAPAARDPQAQLLDLSDRVRRHELVAFLEIGADAVTPHDFPDAGTDGEKTNPAARVSYYTNAGGIDELRRWLSGPVNDGIRMARLERIGVAPGHFDELSSSVPVDRLSLVERDERTGEIREAHKRGDLEGFFVPFAVAMILAMIVMVGSAPMLHAVTQDKSQRVVEMLLGSVTPLELMAGKVVAAAAVSVTSSILYVAAGTLVLQGMGLMGMLSLTILPWFYIYLLADVVMLCAIAAALGAACSTPQDAQSLAIVQLAPIILPMFMLTPVLRQPNGALATVLSLMPPFTPVLMLLRQAMPNGVPAWQPWAGLAGILIFAVAAVWAASRIFRVAILMQGKPPNMAELVRWAVRG